MMDEKKSELLAIVDEASVWRGFAVGYERAVVPLWTAEEQAAWDAGGIPDPDADRAERARAARALPPLF